MRKQLAKTLLVAGTVAAAVGLAAPAALAAGTWTVTGGPNFTSSGTGTFTLTDTTHSATFTCHVGAAAGSVTDQTSGPSPFGSVTSSSFGTSSNKCSGPLGSTGTSNQKAGTTAKINGTSFLGGVTTGTITGVDHIFTASAFGINCTAEITGTAGVTYTNSTHVLAFTTAGDSLTVKSASGCLGIITAGDHVTFTGSETVTGSPTSSIQISSP
jgi:hypothetical protein